MAKVRTCTTVIYPREVYFASKSYPGVTHTVISGSILNDSFCTCVGWHNRGHCSHQDEVDAATCDWVGGPSDQFDVPADQFECPKCGAPTEDYELEPEYT